MYLLDRHFEKSPSDEVLLFIIMRKKMLEQITKKNKNFHPYVKSVSEKEITYTDEFKRHFMAENEKGKFHINVEQIELIIGSVKVSDI